jgi:hypothetical protein
VRISIVIGVVIGYEKRLQFEQKALVAQSRRPPVTVLWPADCHGVQDTMAQFLIVPAKDKALLVAETDQAGFTKLVNIR